MGLLAHLQGGMTSTRIGTDKTKTGGKKFRKTGGRYYSLSFGSSADFGSFAVSDSSANSGLSIRRL